MGEFASKGVAGSGLGLGIADANGKIDLEKAYASALRQMEKQGSVLVGDYKADRADIDALHEIAKRFATTE